MQCRLNVTFAKPEWADENLIRQHIGWDTFGLSLIIPETDVQDRLAQLYALTTVDGKQKTVESVEVVYLKEED